MQTIKTAAIVVLMLTVLYGGYVSLTTPPEPLPEEINEVLVIEESLGSEFASADQLPADLGLAEPPAEMFGSDDAAAPTFSAPLPVPATGNVASDSPAGSTASPGGSFADLRTQRTNPPTGLASHSANTSSGPRKLPAASPPANPVTPGPMAGYESTSNAFELPDPQSVAAKFDSTKGVPFTGKTIEGESLTSPDLNTATTALDALASTPPAAEEDRGLANAIAKADQLYSTGRLKEALATLSVFYGMPGIPQSQHQQLLSRLDPLAREVIYSRRHLLEQPHKVRASESLTDIAQRYDVPWQLLAKINGVEDPITVLPGTELKMVRGPFRADVDLTGKQLTLFLGDLYAGRFNVEVGSDPPPATGTFSVQEKQQSRVYYDRNGSPIPAGSPDNPYGKMWLDLGGQICIHGSPNTVQPTDKGCISVAGDLSDDVFAILSQGSSVTIRR